ncbi:MAG TPA: penicillin-binding transpeptidase domain-containing protein [Polyangia bacterium]|jgi:cell division protein FtsI (penicillin-binding protein 3)
MSGVISRWTKIRIVVFGVLFAALFGAVGRRAYRLQVGDEAERMRGKAEEQYLREVELPPRRGRILDRNGAELASTADVDSIYCNPRRLLDTTDAARKLARILGLDHKELAQRLAQKRFFAWVKRKVTPEEVEAVKTLGLPGMGYTREPRRFYPNRTLAATVMGHSGADGHGQEGVELAFDRYLRGQSGSLQGVRDALGRELFVDGMGETGGDAGSDVVLTIDRYLTFVTERAIDEAQALHHAKAVIAVVMDPRTGELLAVASTPSYNPNDPSSAAEHGARDRVITDAFEPGSTMKTFTIAAALDAGVVRPDDRFDCLMGRMMVGKYTIHDTHPHGLLTVAEVFKFSSNIGAAKIARRLGKERLSDALNRFGFGHPTGLGLPGERSGMLRAVEKWGDIGFANVSFGQGITATPLQIASGMAAIAAGGIYHPPRVVARVLRADGSVEPLPERPETRVISERAAREMTGIMLGVTETGGTARAAAIDGYPVAGKTGTAQKVSGGHYDSSKWVSSFIGFAPAQAPRVAIVVMVDEPQGGHLGGAVAAPVFKEIAEQALRYLHVPPQPTVVATKENGTKENGRKGSTKSTATSGARAAAEVSDEDELPGSDVPEIRDADLDNGDADTAPVPAVAAAAPAGGDDVGEDDRAEGDAGDKPESSKVINVPNFRGLTIAAALRTARQSGVQLAFDDRREPTGVALGQFPAPGPAQRGVVCRVAFGRPE